MNQRVLCHKWLSCTIYAQFYDVPENIGLSKQVSSTRARLKLAAAIVRELARSPKSLRHVIDANYEDNMRKYVSAYYRFSRGLPILDLLDITPEIEETIYPYSFLEGQATPTDLALLKGLARRHPDCRYL